MAKTPLFRLIQKLSQQTQWLNQNHISASTEEERLQEMKFAVSRRKMLQASVGVMSTAAVSSLLQACQTGVAKPFQSKKLENDPIIIVGAGAAGLAAAYSLKKAGQNFLVFEGSPRLGGRIYSKYNFNSSQQFIEAGAELVDSNHSDLIQLAQELQVPIEDFISVEAGIVSELFFVQGRIRSQKEFIMALKPLVKKTAQVYESIFVGDSTATYDSPIKNSFLFKYDRMSLKEFLDKECPACEAWAKKIIEIAYVGELGLEAEQINSLSFIQMFNQNLDDVFSLFGSSDEAKRIQGGGSRLIEALTKSIGADQFIRMNHQLLAMKQTGSGINLTFQNGNSTSEVRARQVIVAMPLTSLRKVEGISNMGLSPQKIKLINQLQYGTNSKLMTSYRSRFWRESHPKRTASSGAVFGDFLSQSFWETSRLQKGDQGILTNFSGGVYGKNISEKNFQGMMADLMKIHPQAQSEFTGEQFLANWSKSPWVQGSYACISPGQYLEFWGTGKEPELNGQLIFAGEHTSDDFQGFMNGAIESGFRAAKQSLISRGVNSLAMKK